MEIHPYHTFPASATSGGVAAHHSRSHYIQCGGGKQVPSFRSPSLSGPSSTSNQFLFFFLFAIKRTIMTTPCGGVYLPHD